MNTGAYNRAVLAWFDRPAPPLGSGLTGTAGAPERGAHICIGADLQDDQLCQIGFRAFACPHIIAACHWMCVQLEGQPATALLQFPRERLQAEFDIPVEKTGKLLILQDALRDCYAKYAVDRDLPGRP